jgi:hypothetical protein
MPYILWKPSQFGAICTRGAAQGKECLGFGMPLESPSRAASSSKMGSFECLRSRRAHPRVACAVATLCCSPPRERDTLGGCEAAAGVGVTRSDFGATRISANAAVTSASSGSTRISLTARLPLLPELPCSAARTTLHTVRGSQSRKRWSWSVCRDQAWRAACSRWRIGYLATLRTRRCHSRYVRLTLRRPTTRNTRDFLGGDARHARGA